MRSAPHFPVHHLRDNSPLCPRLGAVLAAGKSLLGRADLGAAAKEVALCRRYGSVFLRRDAATVRCASPTPSRTDGGGASACDRGVHTRAKTTAHTGRPGGLMGVDRRHACSSRALLLQLSVERAKSPPVRPPQARPLPRARVPHGHTGRWRWRPLWFAVRR